MRKILACCYGTRPEFIKIAPIVLKIKKNYPSINPILVCSQQHGELLQGLDEVFGLTKHRDLNVRGQIGDTVDLSSLISGLQQVFSQELLRLKPNGVLVQGDTASVLAASLAAFHQKLPLYYIEGGLRTDDLNRPYPEEAYRQMVSRISDVIFAPTQGNRNNLLSEGIGSEKIFVTGNPVVDAVEMIGKKLKKSGGEKELESVVPEVANQQYEKLAVIEVHRREGWGEPMERVMKALLKVKNKHPEYLFVFPVHPNKKVQEVVLRYLARKKGFVLIKPLTYLPFMALLKRASVIITDSGGIQEEGPTLGIPVLVAREKTERPEAVEKGWAKLVGFDEKEILEGFLWAGNWKKPRSGNPFGNGHASEKITRVINKNL